MATNEWNATGLIMLHKSQQKWRNEKLNHWR